MTESLESVLGRALRRVKATNLPTRVPLVYRDPAKVLTYGTAWAREDLSPALRAELDAIHGRAVGMVLASRTQPHRADGLQVVAWADGECDHVQYTDDAALIARHPRVCECTGDAKGVHTHDSHAKVIFANASRNAWCNVQGRTYKRTAAGQAVATERDAEPEDLGTTQAALRRNGGLDKRAKVIAQVMTLAKTDRQGANALIARHGITRAEFRDYLARRTQATA